MIGAVVGLVLAASGSVEAQVQLRAGYDSNLFYGAEQVLAEPAASEEASETQAVARDAFVSVHPALDGALFLGRFRLGAGYELQLTQFAQYAHGYFLIQRASLDQQVRIKGVALGLFEQGEQADISAFRSARLQRALFGPSASFWLGPVDLAARVELGLRHFPYREIAPHLTEDDQFIAAAAIARWNLGLLALDAALRLERRESNARAFDGDLEQLDVGATWGKDRFLLAGQLELLRLGLGHYPVSDTENGRQDLQLGARVDATVRLGAFTPGIELGYQRDFSNYAPADFKRFVAALQVGWHWDWQSNSVAPSVRPLAVGRYRLEVDLPGAKKVSVVGSFEGWKSHGLAMREERPGHFAIELDLKPGRYRYQLLVDGVRQVPPGAQGYEPDGLGGTDAVLEVPGASISGDVR